MMPPNVLVCPHCKRTVKPEDLRGPTRFVWQGKGNHAIAVLDEGGPLDSNRRRTVISRRVLVCLVGLTRWH